MWEKQYTFYSFILYLFETRNLSYVAHLAKVMSSPVTFVSVHFPTHFCADLHKKASVDNFHIFGHNKHKNIFSERSTLAYFFLCRALEKFQRRTRRVQNTKKKIIRQNLQNLNKNPMSSTNANEERVKT